MKRLLIYLPIIFLFFSCGTYRYYQPTPTPTLFKNQGELQISGDLGSSGYSMKGAYALPKNIGIVGMYNSTPFDYRAKEGEIGIGYYTESDPAGIFVLGGLGFGSNQKYSDSTHSYKTYEGDFIRPFIQFNGGIASGNGGSRLKGHVIATLKSSYLMYDGKHLDGTNDKIHSRYLLIEPGFAAGFGSRVFKFDFIMSMPIHPTTEQMNDRRNARTYPFTVGFGIRFVMGRNKDD